MPLFVKGWTALLCSVALLGAGAVLVRPAAATVGIDWGRVWRNRLEPRADTRYYTRARADHRFAPKPRVLRGDFALQGAADNGDELYAEGISWGWDLGRAPRVHVVTPFHRAPRGCFGNVNHPNARSGNLCVFERFASVNASRLSVCDSFNECPSADPFGATPGRVRDQGRAVRDRRHVGRASATPRARRAYAVAAPARRRCQRAVSAAIPPPGDPPRVDTAPGSVVNRGRALWE